MTLMANHSACTHIEHTSLSCTFAVTDFTRPDARDLIIKIVDSDIAFLNPNALVDLASR